VPLACTDPLVGPKRWKGKGDLVQDNIKMDLEETDGVGPRTGLIWLRIETGVGLL
jgi:hypothetical protein